MGDRANRAERAARRVVQAVDAQDDALNPREGVRRNRRERDPPIFRGEDTHEDAVDWLSRYEEISRYNGWDDDEKLRSFGMHLEGTARRWHLSLLQAPNTFVDLRDRFLLAFKPPNYDLDLETKLRNRSQGDDESVTAYCHDIIYLCSRVDRNMNEATKVQHLLRGLKRSLVERVYPFLDPAHHSSLDFIRLVQVQCQAVMLANRGTSLPPTPLATIPPIAGPSAYVTQEELRSVMREIKEMLHKEVN